MDSPQKNRRTPDRLQRRKDAFDDREKNRAISQTHTSHAQLEQSERIGVVAQLQQRFREIKSRHRVIAWLQDQEKYLETPPPDEEIIHTRSHESASESRSAAVEDDYGGPLEKHSARGPTKRPTRIPAPTYSKRFAGPLKETGKEFCAVVGDSKRVGSGGCGREAHAAELATMQNKKEWK